MPPHMGELVLILTLAQGGRPQVAPTAGFYADEIRPGLEIESAHPARADDIRPYGGAAEPL